MHNVAYWRLEIKYFWVLTTIRSGVIRRAFMLGWTPKKDFQWKICLLTLYFLIQMNYVLAFTFLLWWLVHILFMCLPRKWERGCLFSASLVFPLLLYISSSNVLWQKEKFTEEMATIESIFTRAVEKKTLSVLRKECYLRPCSRGVQYSSGKNLFIKSTKRCFWYLLDL